MADSRGKGVCKGTRGPAHHHPRNQRLLGSGPANCVLPAPRPFPPPPTSTHSLTHALHAAP